MPHARRVPAHIGKEQLARIRQAAYTLPQVVKPADYLAEKSAASRSTWTSWA